MPSITNTTHESLMSSFAAPTSAVCGEEFVEESLMLGTNYPRVDRITFSVALTTRNKVARVFDRQTDFRIQLMKDCFVFSS